MLFDLRDFGWRIQDRRLNAGLSLRELGAKLGVAASTLSRIENAAGSPDVETFLKLAAWINLPMPEFKPCSRCDGSGFVSRVPIRNTDEPRGDL